MCLSHLPQIALLLAISSAHRPNHPSLHEENRASPTMKRPPSDEPNLEDILARDFSELNIGEDNIPVDAEADQTAEEAAPEAASSTPTVYNQRIDAVEDREVFTVNAPSKGAKAPPDEDKKTSAVHVLKEASSQLGDDFDVDW